MFKVDLPMDPREAAKIQARRARNEERSTRIHDSKQRTMGLDLGSLDAQIEEKKRREAAEKEFNATADAETLRHAKIMELLVQRQEHDRRELAKADIEFRATQQLKQTRREYDLNDPAMLKTATLTRTGDVDDRLGVSSLQIFQGEDLTANERKKLQSDQQRQWLQDQRDLEKTKREAAQYEQQCEEAFQLQQTVHLHDSVQAEQARRQELSQATRQFNKEMADNKATQKKTQREAELAQNATDQLSTYHSTLLSEDQSAPSSVPVASFKGMSEAERAKYRAAQLAQIEEKKAKTREIAREDALHEHSIAVLDRTMQLHERASARTRRELAQQQNAENLALAAEQKARRDYENKVASRNTVASSFHEQFGNDAR